MLSVFIYKDKSKNFTKFEARGHAGFNEKGKDIVCAATSTLLQTCILGLQKQKIKAKTLLKKEYLSWTLLKNNTRRKMEEANLLINTMLIGLNKIQKKYPKNLKISTRRD